MKPVTYLFINSFIPSLSCKNINTSTKKLKKKSYKNLNFKKDFHQEKYEDLKGNVLLYITRVLKDLANTVINSLRQ